MKRIRVRNNLLLLLGIAAITVAAGCKKNNDNNPKPAVAGLMAFNLSPDQSVVGISLSGDHLLPLPYGNYTGGYIRIYPGSRTTESYDVSTGNTLAATTYTYETGKYYSLFVMGSDTSYRNVVVNDGLDTLAGVGGQSYLRYVNAITDSSQFTVTVNNGQNDVVHTSSHFADVSDFIKVDQGSVAVSISNGDSSVNATRTISLQQGRIYTILFLGNPSGLNARDSIRIRYIENGTLEIDSSAAKADSVH